MRVKEAVLRYGAAAQVQFNYHTERLADEGMEPVDYSNVQIDGFPINQSQGTDKITFAGASLILNSNTTLRLFFRVDASVESFTVSCMDRVLELGIRGDLYYVDIENISAPELNQWYSVTVNDGVQTGEITYSPLCYCAKVKKNEAIIRSDSLLNVTAALYLYWEAANSYFNPRHNRLLKS